MSLYISICLFHVFVYLSAFLCIYMSICMIYVFIQISFYVYVYVYLYFLCLYLYFMSIYLYFCLCVMCLVVNLSMSLWTPRWGEGGGGTPILGSTRDVLLDRMPFFELPALAQGLFQNWDRVAFEPWGKMRQGQILTITEAHPYPFLRRVPPPGMNRHIPTECHKSICRSLSISIGL